jgi:hypothetical protein
MIHIALILILALAGGWTLDHLSRRGLAAAERQALDARAFELTTRALVPGSALACLDALAGADVEEPCEKALFASPEATAAAVSYVAAQLRVLAAAHEDAQRAGPDAADMFAPLRRAVEADRFGIVAHVLTVSDHCSPQNCAALAVLRDSSRVGANLRHRPFETLLKRHMAAWPDAGSGSAAGRPAVTGSAVVPHVAGAKPANNLFFPSSSSIPPVHIMTAEPATPRQPPTNPAGPTDAAAAPRKAAPGAPARQPASPGPTSLAPPGVQ